MGNAMKFEDWKAQAQKKSFAQEQLSALKDVSCVHGNPGMAQDVMNICKPGQVQLAINFFNHEVEQLKMKKKEFPASIREHAWHLKMFAETIDEKEKFSPDMIPDALMDSRNNWRAKHAVLGAVELMEFHAKHIEKKMSKMVKVS